MHWEWLAAPDYWAGRLILERLLAVCYLLAFVSTLHQFRPLVGSSGLTPIPRLLARTGFRRTPSLFHLHYSDRFFAVIASIGALLSATVLFGLYDLLPVGAHLACWLLIWLLYLSIVNVGGVWYGFGWESLLLEAGFLAIFLGPSYQTPQLPVLLAFLWLLFRVEFGAGMIKMRSDPCWRELTCLYYHHETQPMPGPFSWFFHHLPKPLHKVEVAASHVTQLIVPFGLFAPQPVANVCAVLVIVTQAWLMASGNFAWLNLITITLGFAALDDSLLPITPPARLTGPPVWFLVTMLGTCAAIVVLSYWPVRNLLSRHQGMNETYNPLRIVNSYGAFGSVTRERHEVVIEGTDDEEPHENSVWQEYRFIGKPGDTDRLPPQVAPYHLRLDWLMWFAAISPGYAATWLPDLVHKLLQGDRATLKLFRHNPFPSAPPANIRVLRYHYRFSTPTERRATGGWWRRRYLSEDMPPMSLARHTGGHR
jgi:hypothetical protein